MVFGCHAICQNLPLQLIILCDISNKFHKGQYVTLDGVHWARLQMTPWCPKVPFNLPLKSADMPTVLELPLLSYGGNYNYIVLYLPVDAAIKSLLKSLYTVGTKSVVGESVIVGSNKRESELIREKRRMCRICTSHSWGWSVYGKTLINYKWSVFLQETHRFPVNHLPKFQPMLITRSAIS